MKRSQLWVRAAALSAVALFGVGSVAFGGGRNGAPGGGAASVATGAVAGGQATMTPSQQVAAARASRASSAQENASRESILQQHLDRRAHIPNHAGVGVAAAGSRAAVAAAAPDAGTESVARAISAQAPGTFTVTVDSVPPTATGAADVMEPTEAQS